MSRHRTELVETSARLIAEFEGTHPPGQVISAVVRSQHLVVRSGSREADPRAWEDIARRLLAGRSPLSRHAGNGSVPAIG